MMSYINLILHGFRNLTKHANSFPGYLKLLDLIAKTKLRDDNKLWNEMDTALAAQLKARNRSTSSTQLPASTNTIRLSGVRSKMKLCLSEVCRACIHHEVLKRCYKDARESGSNRWSSTKHRVPWHLFLCTLSQDISDYNRASRALISWLSWSSVHSTTTTEGPWPWEGV